MAGGRWPDFLEAQRAEVELPVQDRRAPVISARNGARERSERIDDAVVEPRHSTEHYLEPVE